MITFKDGGCSAGAMIATLTLYMLAKIDHKIYLFSENAAHNHMKENCIIILQRFYYFVTYYLHYCCDAQVFTNTGIIYFYYGLCTDAPNGRDTAHS